MSGVHGVVATAHLDIAEQKFISTNTQNRSVEQPMYNCKKDANHNLIADVFMQAGWYVIDTSWSKGKLLDLIVYKRKGQFWFVEVKVGNKPLTDAEKKFIQDNSFRCVVIRSVDEAIKFVQNALKMAEV